MAADGQIDVACDQFEAALMKGDQPKIESFLEGWAEPERSKLLSELIAIELKHRSHKGEEPAQEEYEKRFSTYGVVVSEVFGQQTRGATTVASCGADSLIYQSQLHNLQFLARGGLGVVYTATDRELNRETAVKFLNERLLHNDEARERFHIEAEITGRLEHPGIAPVHGIGETESGSPYYAMRFIHGETMREAIDRYHKANDKNSTETNRDVVFCELLSRFVAVCKTIAYAHNRGIIHRDLKPDNVMLGRYGETIVVDWGLAISVGREGVFKESCEQTLVPNTGGDSASSSGGGAGTPAYMSPEQAAGNVNLGPATDIYSLGVVFYKLISGKLPFFGGGANEVCTAVMRGDFAKPTKVNKNVPKALEAICLKAMAIEPGNRYATALDLARDIDRYLADAEVKAYKDPLSAKIIRWAKRNRTATAALLALAAFFSFSAFSGAIWMGEVARRESNQRSEAVASKEREFNLRRSSLSVAAEFAARTIANKIDIRLRTLEKIAADPKLRELLAKVNPSPDDEDSRAPLQEWFESECARHTDLQSRSFFVCANDGSQVARYPRFKEDGTEFGSLKLNYTYRDYFHGEGRDYPKNNRLSLPPLTQPHISVAMESTNDGDMIVVFSTGIAGPEANQTIGVIGTSVQFGEFADIKVALPDGQKIVLVDTRPYYMPRTEFPDERGEGLVLQHEDLGNLKERPKLYHVDDKSLDAMMNAKPQWLSESTGQLMNLLPGSYHDPVASDQQSDWLAAFAPVFMNGRPENLRDTGWFVIVQQRHVEAE